MSTFVYTRLHSSTLIYLMTPLHLSSDSSVNLEAASRSCSSNQALLKILRYSHETKAPMLESLFNKVAGLKVRNFNKEETPPQ